MNCSACGHENPERAKFCLECGTPVGAHCASCGAELPPAAKFCLECGARMAAAPGPSNHERTGEARKIVTIVFADLVGSTSLHERLDAESARRLMDRYYAALRATVDAHGGTVVKLLGDGVMAAFGVRQVAEDDAIRAVRAAVAMQDAFRTLIGERSAVVGDIGLRVAVNTGEVVVSDAQDDVIGDPVNVAARLQEQGRDGDVVIGEATRRLVATLVTLAPLGSIALKGRAETVKAYRVASLDPPAGVAAAPFVGRAEELARLGAVYDAAVTTPAARLAVLLGSPGLGKSRLIDEFVRGHGDTVGVLTAHCDAAGGDTFGPLAEALLEWLQGEGGNSDDTHAPRLDDEGEDLRAKLAAHLPAESERARIVDGIAALLAGSPAAPEETFFVVRRLLTGLAAEKPVVLVIDDLQWAEPLLLDLVEHLVQWGSGARLLVLVGARPELRERRSALATPGTLVADVVTLAGLDAGAAMRLAANVIGAADLPAAVAAKVLATSEGNPLFVGELVRMLVQEGALTKEGDRWTIGAGLEALEMPPTIHALLAARIERLPPDERAVLERAAVVGRHFSRNAVAALLPGEGSDLDERLEALRRAELIEPDAGWLFGEPVLRFHHVLIRDAAYRRLLKETRADLHARLADWIEARVDDAAELDETIGRHLEQACRHRRELGPLDAEGQSLGERASRHLAAAGRRALARDDVPLAAGLLGRALDLLDADDPARADLALDWCEALLAAGDVGPAVAAIDELGRFTGESARLRCWHTCFAGQHTVLTAPEALLATTDSVAAAAEELTALGDAAGEAKAHFVHALALARLGQVGACEAALDRALAAARRAGDRRRANTVLAIAPLAALWGPSPVTRASGRCLDVVRVLRITQGAPAVEAVALSCQGVLEALRGRGDAAKRMIGSARTMVEELGITQRLFEVDVFRGQVALLEGDAADAERSLRGAYEGLRDLGLGIDAARAAALLARALLAQERVDEAEVLSHESEALAGDDLKAAIAWRGVRAEALARRGERAEAVELASKAVEIAAATDALLDHADACMALTAALRAAGRGAEADAEEHGAIELWEAKGATLLVEQARRAEIEPIAKDGLQGGSIAPARDHRQRPPRRQRPEDARLESLIANRDFTALEQFFSHFQQRVDHTTGAVYGRDGVLRSLRSLLRARDARLRFEALAGLGDTLALTRQWTWAGGTAGGGLDVGAFEREEINVSEADKEGHLLRTECFAADRLGEAVVRLYERYAELLPEGPARTRVATIARSIEGFRGLLDVERVAEAIGPDYEQVDHRQLSTWSACGADEALEHYRALRDVVAESQIRVDDVLALGPDATLERRMHSGIDRESGGRYERVFLYLFVAGTDGRAARVEFFDADREAEALARFEALTGTPAKPPAARRVRTNAATTAEAACEARIAARDFEAVRAAFSDQHREVDHTTGSSYGADECVASLERLFRSRDPHFEIEPIATLGPSLALGRRRSGASGAAGTRYDVAEYQDEKLQVFEVDERGLFCHAEVFAGEHLGDAIACLYTRYAESLSDGPARERAARTARSIAATSAFIMRNAKGALDWASDVEFVDHRKIGLPSARGVEGIESVATVLFELADDVTIRLDDVFCLEPSAHHFRTVVSGMQRDGGGAFEIVSLDVVVYDTEGRVCRYELFDADAGAEALARFDELTSDTQEPTAFEPPWSNAATHAVERLSGALASGDWNGVDREYAPDFRFEDRRRLSRVDTGREEYLAGLRMLFDQPGRRWEGSTIGTRGQRLALGRVAYQAEVEGGGPLELPGTLALYEVGADGRCIAFVLFDLEDEDAAWAELDRRYEAGDGAEAARIFHEFSCAVMNRDWDGLIALCDPAFIEYDNRSLSLVGTTDGAEAWAKSVGTHLELAPDTVYRIEHMRGAGRFVLWQIRWEGTRDGGRYELPLCGVTELNEQGKLATVEIYDPEQLEQVRVRFAALTDADAAKSRVLRFANAATRTVDSGMAALAARDWRAFSALFAADFRNIDRRALVHLESGREQWLAAYRQIVEMTSSRPTYEVLATRGERFTLAHTLWQGARGDVGPSEIERLLLVEVDEHGNHRVVVIFDPDEVVAARAELDARFAAGEGPACPDAIRWLTDYLRAFAAKDLDALAALLSSDLVAHNHRLVGWGTRHGPEGVVSTMRAQFELAPDTQARVDHVRLCECGMILEYAWHGTREGGAFENLWVDVFELDDHGRVCRADVFEPAQIEEARSRFDEIDATLNRDPHAAIAKPNIASASMERWLAAFAAGANDDWEAMRALCAPGLVLEDRQRLSRVCGDRELMVASLRERTAAGARVEPTLIGTAGDRIAIFRQLWSGGPAAGRFEIEYLALMELDTAGLYSAMILFDVDDTRAAQREAWARWAAIEPGVAATVAVLSELIDAFDGRDRARFRDLYADDLVVEDHRRAGMGRVEGHDAYIDSIAVLWDLAPATKAEQGWFWPAVNAHGGLTVLRRYGDAADGGAFESGAFESEYLNLFLHADGRVTHVELFEIDALEDALARFEELCAASSPN